MNRILWLAVLIVVSWSALHGAQANDPALEAAYTLYRQGKYVTAAEQALEINSVEAKILAGRSYLAEAGYVEKGVGERARKLLDLALEVTEGAVIEAPTNVEALLYRVLAIGYLSRIKGNWSAHRDGLGREAQDLVKRALALEPDNGWAHIVNCGWHAEIVDGAGGFMASIMYGASRKKALASCERAIELDPDDLVFRVEYGRALLRLSRKRHAAAARTQLMAAQALEARDHFEKLVQAQGEELLAALERGDKQEFKQVFKRLDAFR